MLSQDIFLKKKNSEVETNATMMAMNKPWMPSQKNGRAAPSITGWTTAISDARLTRETTIGLISRLEFLLLWYSARL